MSARCLKQFEIGLCIECDPFVGTGNRNTICLKTCNDWHEACKNDYFSISNSQPFIFPCLSNSLVCYPVHSFITSGRDFCMYLGLNVSKKMCYDGSFDPATLKKTQVKVISSKKITQQSYTHKKKNSQS